MSTFFRCYKAEFLKRKHTIFYPLHIAVPAVFVIGVNLLMMTRGQSIDQNYLILLIFQAISIAMPLLSAVICGLVCDNEANAGSYQNILTSSHSRIITITAQLAMLMTMCAFAITLSIAGIIITMNVFLNGISVSVSLFAVAGVAVWFCMISLYIVNLFFGYKLGIGICSMTGFLGVIIASLGTTVFFDDLWHYIPQSWAIRVTTALLEQLDFTFLGVRGISLLTLIVIILVSGWFKSWEGTKGHE